MARETWGWTAGEVWGHAGLREMPRYKGVKFIKTRPRLGTPTYPRERDLQTDIRRSPITFCLSRKYRHAEVRSYARPLTTPQAFLPTLRLACEAFSYHTMRTADPSTNCHVYDRAPAVLYYQQDGM